MTARYSQGPLQPRFRVRVRVSRVSRVRVMTLAIAALGYSGPEPTSPLQIYVLCTIDALWSLPKAKLLVVTAVTFIHLKWPKNKGLTCD